MITHKRTLQLLGEMLAVIHGDGGHYTEQHGHEKAVADALAKYHALLERVDMLVHEQNTYLRDFNDRMGKVASRLVELEEENARLKVKHPESYDERLAGLAKPGGKITIHEEGTIGFKLVKDHGDGSATVICLACGKLFCADPCTEENLTRQNVNGRIVLKTTCPKCGAWEEAT